MNSYSWALQSTVHNTLSYISKSSEISILEDTDVPLVHHVLFEKYYKAYHWLQKLNF